MKNVSHVGFKPMTLISMPAEQILASGMNYWLVLMLAACSLQQGCGLNPIESKYFFLFKLLITGIANHGAKACRKHRLIKHVIRL